MSERDTETPVPEPIPTEHTGSVGVLRERVAILERADSEKERRLREGSRTFGDLRDGYAELRDSIAAITATWGNSLREVEAKAAVAAETAAARATAAAEKLLTEIKAEVAELKPRAPSKLTLLGSLFGIVVFVGGLVWAASRYPERGEFQRLSDKLNQTEITEHDLARDLTDARERLRAIEGHKP